MAEATHRPTDALAPGLRIGPYLLLVPLGSGGSGRVWAVARTGQLGFTKRLALKVMRGDKLGSERARQRFDREARLGAQLRHSNLRAVHELGNHQGRPYMVMSWVDAALDELIQHAPARTLDARVVCWLGIQACAALAAAHEHVNAACQPRPVVHGDVSPGNILLSRGGHVLLADLVAASDAVPTPGSAERSPASSFFGKLGYAAPEAVRGERCDGRSDLFSLGCVLYEALSGVPAFEGEDERAVMFQVLQQSPPDVQSRVPGIPDDVARVVRRALQRRVADRFQSASEMRAALCACVADHSDFELERRTAAVIEQVLGGRMHERERAIASTLQQFSPSALERTDTLPIGNAVRALASTTLRISAEDLPPSTRRASSARAASPAPPPRRRRRALALSGLLLLSVPGLYVAYRAYQPAAPPLASPAPPAGSEPAVPPQVRELEAAQALRPVASEPPAAIPPPAAEAAPPAEPAARAAPPPAAAPAGDARRSAVRATESRRRRKSATADPLADPPPEPAAPAARVPEPAAPRPFQWHFPDDPYVEPAAP